MTASVQLLSDTIDAGQEAFVIQTPLATFIYHKEGGGFSHLIDVDGNDWIGYAPGDGPAGEYRGIPNMVFRGSEGGFFHPGHTGSKGSSTQVVVADPHLVSLVTTSCDGCWQVRWDLFAAFARMRVLRVNGADPGYWFLYEGTPGGSFDPARSRSIRSSGENLPLSEPWAADVSAPAWAGFTDPAQKRALVLCCERPSVCPDEGGDGGDDMYKPMAPMTVFGFGRRLTGVDALLREAGSLLYVGLVEAATRDAIDAAVTMWERDGRPA